ncbi:MAG: hypothetical protein WDN48_01590 [Pseudolabrys sp.]
MSIRRRTARRGALRIEVDAADIVGDMRISAPIEEGGHGRLSGAGLAAEQHRAFADLNRASVQHDPAALIKQHPERGAEQEHHRVAFGHARFDCIAMLLPAVMRKFATRGTRRKNLSPIHGPVWA